MKLFLSSLLIATPLLAAPGKNKQEAQHKTLLPPPSRPIPPSSSSEAVAQFEGGASRDDATRPNQELDEKRLLATTLVLWKLSRGETPNPTQLGEAGITRAKARRFMQNLPASAKPRAEDRALLSTPYVRRELPQRLEARERFVNFVARFQEVFPELQDSLPEILTVWGEARNLRGLSDADDLVQQAKMAAVVHVLRNRTRQQRRSATPARFQLKPHQLKWLTATRRYQFSAFEPFDPNLVLIAFGPSIEGSLEWGRINAHEMRSLQNLARTLVKLQKREIILVPPLAADDIYHYLTPELLDYDAKFERELRSVYGNSARQRPLRVPTSKPRFLAIVPNWATQEAMILEPPVRFDGSFFSASEVKVPLNDFIFFQGVW